MVVDFKIQLFLRQARCDYKNTQFKIKETMLEILNKREQTENKIRSYYHELIAFASQLQTGRKFIQ